MEKFQWGGMESEYNIYMDENNRRMTMNLRNNFARLAEALIAKGQKDKAIAVLDRCLEVMPERNVPYNFFMLPIVESYYHAGAYDKANALNKRLYDIYEDDLDYYLSLPQEYQKSVQNELNRAIAVLNRLVQLAQINSQQELYKELSERYQSIGLPNMNQMQ
jgi:tetratricopeptide (TPR) repeat protein